MGREFIGECLTDSEFGTYEMELAIKYIKQACGPPPRGVDVEITWEGTEVGNEGNETQYPVISVVWDDYSTGYPERYIQKCIQAFEQFDLPAEIQERRQEDRELQADFQEIWNLIGEHLQQRSTPKSRSKS